METPRADDAGGPLNGADALVAAFVRWAAEERAQAGNLARSRERWMRQQASEAATLIGLLVEVAERSDPVTVTTSARAWSGRLVGIGSDFCIIEDRAGSAVVVPTESIASIAVHDEETTGPDLRSSRFSAVDRRLPGRVRHGDPSGDRAAPIGMRFADVLAVLGADRNPVRLVTTASAVLSGRLVGVGADVITLETDGPARTRLHVPLRSIAACLPS